MTLEEWLKEKSETMHLVVSRENRASNSFTHKTWRLRPKSGLTIFVSEDINGDISLVDSSIFKFKDFNKAEGLSQEFMKETLDKLLSDDYFVQYTRVTHRPYLKFKDKNSGDTIYGKASVFDQDLRTRERRKSMIRPGLLRHSIDYRWQEKELSPFGSKPNIRWAIVFEVTLFDYRARKILNESRWKRFKARHPGILNSRYNTEGALGELFGFAVCSPAFANDPPDEAASDLIKRALIQDVFNEDGAIVYLNTRIESIGDKRIDAIGSDFRKFLETEEWDYILD